MSISKNYSLDVKRLNKTKKTLAFLCGLRYTIIVPKKGLRPSPKERKIIMRIERVENIVLNDNDTKLLADFLDLMDEIEREVVNPDIKNIIKNIHQDINELEDYLSYE